MDYRRQSSIVGEKLASNDRAMTPHFFVIGAQKAGSTFLLQCLGEHPQIFMPPAEIAFFEDSLYRPDSIADFEKHFVEAKADQVVGVKRANVLGHPECPARLKRHMPDLKLIAILRHPIERTVSAYYHYMASGFVPIVGIETGLRQLLDGQYDHLPRAAEIIDFGLYHKHLLAYERVFPRDRIHVTLLEDIRDNAQQTLEKIYKFLDVQLDFRPTSAKNQPMAAIYSLNRLRLRDALERHCRSHAPDGKYLTNRRGPLATPLYAASVVLDRFLWSRLFSANRPVLSASLTEQLIQIFRPDVDRLESWLGRPLGHWKVSGKTSQ